jgi:hypothetical protein
MYQFLFFVGNEENWIKSIYAKYLNMFQMNNTTVYMVMRGRRAEEGVIGAWW